MTFSFGCKRPLVAPHHIKPSFRMHPAMAAVKGGASSPALADAISMRAMGLNPDVKDQGGGDEGTGSCEGHSSSSATQSRMAARGTPLTYTPSEAGIYRGGRQVERARVTPIDQPLPKLVDEGAQSEDIVYAMSHYGIRAREIDRTHDGRNSDCEVATINDDESLGQDEKSARRALVIPPKHAIDPSASDMVTQARASLTALIPIRLDFWVDSAFQNWTPGAPAVGVPDLSDPIGGGHAVVLTGFKRTSSGLWVFELLNSWGTEIADAGYWLVGEACLRNAWSLIPWDVDVVEVFS